jgi:hypothetical protein
MAIIGSRLAFDFSPTLGDSYFALFFCDLCALPPSPSLWHDKFLRLFPFRSLAPSFSHPPFFAPFAPFCGYSRLIFALMGFSPGFAGRHFQGESFLDD